ncbi:MAG: lysylphosphatidylglycerol synthase transmembrane domain-containing protein [Stellaceae bacterium]
MRASSRHPATRPRLRFAVIIANALLVVLVVGVILGLKEERRVFDLLQRINLSWIAVAIGLQVGTYFCTGGAWQVILGHFHKRVTVGAVAKLSLEKLFLDQILPTFGLGGSLAMARSLLTRGVRENEAAATILIDAVSYFGAYLVLFLGAVGLLWGERLFSPVIRYLALSFSAILLCAIGVVVFLIARANSGLMPAWTRRFGFTRELAEALKEAPAKMMKARGAWAWAFLLETGVFALDIATFWVIFRALGAPITANEALVSFMLAAAVSTLSIIPGGLGFFEGGAIATLNVFGITVGTAAAGVVLLRGFTYWLPMLPGYLIFRAEMVTDVPDERLRDAVAKAPNDVG